MGVCASSNVTLSLSLVNGSGWEVYRNGTSSNSGFLWRESWRFVAVWNKGSTHLSRLKQNENPAKPANVSSWMQYTLSLLLLLTRFPLSDRQDYKWNHIQKSRLYCLLYIFLFFPWQRRDRGERGGKIVYISFFYTIHLTRQMSCKDSKRHR